ncbi:hypothetical protein P5V15_009015 [Pogonomyrmex californicus]
MENDFTDSHNVSTSMYTADKYNEYSIQIMRWILRAISLWPLPVDASIIEKICSDFTICLCYFLMIVIMVPNGLSIFIESQESYETIIRNIGPITFWFIAMVNYSCLLMHVDDIRACVEHVKADWRVMSKTQNRQVMLKTARIGRFITGFCAVFMHSGVFSYNVAQGLSKDILQVGNSSIEVRVLPYPFYSKILDTHYSPAYECIFFVQCLSSFVVNSVTVATCSIGAVFVMHACGQLRIMMSLLENLVDERNEEKTSVRQRFVIIVEHHLRVLGFVSRIEKIMNIVCLVELIGCTMHICLVGYYFILDLIQGKDTESVVSYSMLLSSITFNIFIFCYIGETLSEQGGQIGKSVYMTNWYLLPGKTARGLILIILRSNADLKLTAGKIVQLSFSTFGDVIKSALAYLNILRTILIM